MLDSNHTNRLTRVFIILHCSLEATASCEIPRILLIPEIDYGTKIDYHNHIHVPQQFDEAM